MVICLQNDIRFFIRFKLALAPSLKWRLFDLYLKYYFKFEADFPI
jgi:hypothetical protein